MSVVDIDVTVYQFGDDEPEDAWGPEDAIADQVRNLLARAVLLDGLIRVLADSDEPAEVLATIIRRAGDALEDGIDDRAQLRANQILDDCDLVLARIRRGE